MDYKNYIQSRDMSWKILIDMDITALPVPIISICRKLNIFVGYDEELIGGSNDGYSTITPTGAKIAINPSCNKQRKRFTIAHELGHILLDHVGKYELVNREPSSEDNPIEQAANVFASRLLAPACVLKGCDVQSAAEISKLCDISIMSAEYRFKRYQELVKRDKFFISPLERTVYAQFKEFIQGHQQGALY